LALLFQARDPEEHIRQFKSSFPAVTWPLLTLYIAEAVKSGNTQLAEAMREIQTLLRAESAGENHMPCASTTPPTPKPGDETRSLRQWLAHEIGRSEPLSESDLADAMVALSGLLDAEDQQSHLQTHPIPPAVLPLTLHQARLASQEGRKEEAQILGRICQVVSQFRCLPGKMPATTPAEKGTSKNSTIHVTLLAPNKMELSPPETCCNEDQTGKQSRLAVQNY
jgi:hypothetical protein